MLFRRWAGSALRNRNRNRHESSRILQELRKMAILEAATEKPTHERATAPLTSSSSLSPLSMSSGTAAALQSLDEAIEKARGQLTITGGRPGTGVSSAVSSANKVASLSQFMSECCRLRRAIGECREMRNRRLLRETLRSFWAENVDGSLACCALRGRDFGFVAGFGLVDDGLHVHPDSLQLAVHSVMQEINTCSSMDMMLSLHYIARELNHVEKQQKKPALYGTSGLAVDVQKVVVVKEEQDDDNEKETQKALGSPHRRETTHTAVSITEKAREDLNTLRRKIATLGMERIHFFFLQRGSSGRALGSAEDALHALEFLTVLKVSDADESARILVEPRGARDGTLNNYHVVKSLFRHVSTNNKDLKFTSIIHSFRLLRIFLPILLPPTSSPSLQRLSSSSRSCQQEGNAVISGATAVTNSDAPLASKDETLPLVDQSLDNAEHHAQCEAVNHIVWGLCIAIQRRDARFVNPFHFVQVLETISRFPPYVLSRTPRPKRRKVENLALFALSSSGAGCTSEGHCPTPVDGRASQTVEGIWEYMVSKACIFIPSLPPMQRRRVCFNLRSAIVKRANCFACTVSGGRQKSSGLSIAEQLLLPMAHELSQYPKDYQAAMFDHHLPHQVVPALTHAREKKRIKTTSVSFSTQRRK